MATILCVDDDKMALEIRKKLLEIFRFTVLIAFDGEHGIDIVKTVPVDLVLLDYHMPRTNGGIVAKAMKAIRPDIKIVMLTGDVHAPELCEDCDVDLFIVKGQMNPRAMVDVLSKLLGREV